jgi:hypothetical protein
MEAAFTAIAALKAAAAAPSMTPPGGAGPLARATAASAAAPPVSATHDDLHIKLTQAQRAAATAAREADARYAQLQESHDRLAMDHSAAQASVAALKAQLAVASRPPAFTEQAAVQSAARTTSSDGSNSFGLDAGTTATAANAGCAAASPGAASAATAPPLAPTARSVVIPAGAVSLLVSLEAAAPMPQPVPLGQSVDVVALAAVMQAKLDALTSAASLAAETRVKLVSELACWRDEVTTAKAAVVEAVDRATALAAANETMAALVASATAAAAASSGAAAAAAARLRKAEDTVAQLQASLDAKTSAGG